MGVPQCAKRKRSRIEAGRRLPTRIRVELPRLRFTDNRGRGKSAEIKNPISYAVGFDARADLLDKTHLHVAQRDGVTPSHAAGDKHLLGGIPLPALVSVTVNEGDLGAMLFGTVSIADADLTRFEFLRQLVLLPANDIVFGTNKALGHG